MTPQDSEPSRYGKGQEELIHAVVRVVVAEGIGQVTHRRVAAEANVSHGLVRHHFGSLEALIAAGVHNVLERSLRNDPIDVLLAEPPLEREALLEWIDAQWVEQCFEYELVLAARRSTELRPLARDMYDGYVESVTRSLDRHGFQDVTRSEVELLVSAIDGIVLRYVNIAGDKDQWPYDAMAALRGVILEWRKRSIS